MSNQCFGNVPVYPKQEWRCFDQLPRALREIFARAPYQYAVAVRFRDLMALPVAEARRFLIEKICDDIQREALKAYGPEHPDAELSRLDRQQRAA